MDASKEKREEGKLQLVFSTGQALSLPLSAELATPFIAASNPRMFFGTCNTLVGPAHGLLLLSNPTPVPARWRVEHIPAALDGTGAIKRTTSIRVKGFLPSEPQFDDPSVFQLSPSEGLLEGPTVGIAAALSCPPHDVNRATSGLEGTTTTTVIVPQRLVETSWAKDVLSLGDTLKGRHESKAAAGAVPADAIFPVPINIVFQPTKNLRYQSRFRFSCEFGNSFDVILEGTGTYEEHQHKPLNPQPRP